MNPHATVMTPCSKQRQDRAGLIRVAVVCDLAEERWLSMDLAGDMLFQNLEEHCGEIVAARQLRPSFSRRAYDLVPGKLVRNASRWLGRFVYYPRWLRGQLDNFDLFHVVDHSYSQLIPLLPRGRAVVTCHDLDTFRCLLEPNQEKRPAWFRAMAQKILEGFQQAAHVIAVSEATREELLRYRLAPLERITVIPNGVHPSCSPFLTRKRTARSGNSSARALRRCCSMSAARWPGSGWMFFCVSRGRCGKKFRKSG